MHVISRTDPCYRVVDPYFCPWRGMLATFVTVSGVELPQRVSTATSRGFLFITSILGSQNLDIR